LSALSVKRSWRFKIVRSKQHGLVVQKIKGAYDIRLRRKIYINPQSNVLDNSNNQEQQNDQ
jgi:hypothetical protein